MKKLFLMFALTVMLGVPCLSMASSYELSLPLSYGERQYASKWWHAFAEKLKTETNGAVEILIYPNSTLLKASEVGSALLKGSIDMGFVSSMHQDICPYLASITMPFLYKDANHSGRVFQALLKEPILQKELQKVGVPLTGLSAAPNYFGSTTTPIRTMADLKGKRIIVVTPQGAEEVKSWGGNAILVPPTDTYVALQRGMGEVFYGPLNALNSHYELIKHITILPVVSSVTMFMIRHDAMEGMPEVGKKIFAETFPQDFPTVIEMTDKIIEDGYELVEKAKANNTQVLYLDEAAAEEFRKVSLEVFKPIIIEKMTYAKVKKEDAEAWINRIIAVSESVE